MSNEPRVPTAETIRALIGLRGYSMREAAAVVGCDYRNLIRMLNHQHGRGTHHPPEDDNLYWIDLRVRAGKALGLEWGEAMTSRAPEGQH